MQPQNSPHIPTNPNTGPQTETQPALEQDTRVNPVIEQAPAQSTPERQPSMAETGNSPSQLTPPSAVSTPISSLANPATTPAVQPVTTTTPPLLAGNKDDIEKNWVDQADTIMTTQQNDPYLEEESQEDLSKQYLKVRFNIDTKKTDKAP